MMMIVIFFIISLLPVQAQACQGSGRYTAKPAVDLQREHIIRNSYESSVLKPAQGFACFKIPFFVRDKFERTVNKGDPCEVSLVTLRLPIVSLTKKTVEQAKEHSIVCVVLHKACKKTVRSGQQPPEQDRLEWITINSDMKEFPHWEELYQNLWQACKNELKVLDYRPLERLSLQQIAQMDSGNYVHKPAKDIFKKETTELAVLAEVAEKFDMENNNQ